MKRFHLKTIFPTKFNQIYQNIPEFRVQMTKVINHLETAFSNFTKPDKHILDNRVELPGVVLHDI